MKVIEHIESVFLQVPGPDNRARLQEGFASPVALLRYVAGGISESPALLARKGA